MQSMCDEVNVCVCVYSLISMLYIYIYLLKNLYLNYYLNVSHLCGLKLSMQTRFK